MRKKYDNKTRSKLIQAVNQADIKTIESLAISHEMDLQLAIEVFRTALEARHKNMDVFRAILSPYNNNSQKTRSYGTEAMLTILLQVAIETKASVEHIEVLLELGADPSDPRSNFVPYIFTFGRKDLVETFFQKFDLSHRTQPEQEEFMALVASYVFYYYPSEKVGDLLDTPLVAGLSIDKKSMIALAFQMAPDEALESLVKASNVDIKSDPLLYIGAILNGSFYKRVSQTIEQYDIDAEPIMPQILDLICTSKNHMKFSHLTDLIKHQDIAPQTPVGDSKTPLITLLAKEGHIETLETFLKKGFDINTQDSNGLSIVYHTISNGKRQTGSDLQENYTLKFYLNHGLNLNTKDTKNNLNVYELVSQYNRSDMVKTLDTFENTILSEIKTMFEDNTEFLSLADMQDTLLTVHTESKLKGLSFDINFNALSQAICKGNLKKIQDILERSKDDYISYDHIKIFNNKHPLPPQAKENLLLKTGHVSKIFESALWKNNIEKVTEFYESLPQSLQQQSQQAYLNTKHLMTLAQTKSTKPGLKRRVAPPKNQNRPR